ncbi:helix-hairpin-helix domain-containing protein [Clostridium sp. DL1XJH146]
MSKKEKYIGSLVLVVIIGFFSILGYYISYNDNIDNTDISEEDIFEEEEVKENSTNNSFEKKENQILLDNSQEEDVEELKNDEFIFVEIKGQVNKPGVYKIEKNSRINDLVEEAGGFNEMAYTMNICLAEKLEDEETVIVFNKDEYSETLELQSVLKNNSSSEDSTINESKNENESGKININTANKEKLKELPNVGDVTADNIIKYRESVGEFKEIEDIMNVTRIGDKTFEDFKEFICVN